MDLKKKKKKSKSSNKIFISANRKSDNLTMITQSNTIQSQCKPHVYSCKSQMRSWSTTPNFCDFAQETISKNEIVKKIQVQEIFHKIACKQQKVKQVQKIKNSTCGYQKLANKLKLELQGMKNHSSDQAKQKVRLLKSCLSFKHRRAPYSQRKKTIQQELNEIQAPNENNTYSYVNCPKKNDKIKINNYLMQNNASKYPMNDQSVVFKNRQKPNNNSKALVIDKKILEIKKKCQKLYGQSLILKQKLEVTEFYKNLVFKNGNKIVKKII